MIAKEKMFIVAGNVDDSIKSASPIYDITIFPNFLKFEEYINKNPIRMSTIIVSERELPFTSFNMTRLLEIIDTKFLKLDGNCLYLIDNSTSKSIVDNFLEDNEINSILCYQGDLTAKYISDIVSGAARLSDEAETEILTMRIRAKDYIAAQGIKKYDSDDGRYLTDEDLLNDVPDIEEPVISVPTVDILTNIYYVVGANSLERNLFTFIEAQYLSLSGKVVIVESDIMYHRLTDMVKKSRVSYEYIDMDDFNSNCSDVIQQIKSSQSRLIVIGCVNRINYDYDFILDILISNLTGFVDFFIKECDFTQTPYGSFYNIVCADTVPDVLECLNSLKYDIDEQKVIIVGLRTRELGEINISSKEMTDIIQILLGKNKLHAEVVKVSGINLRGDEVVYDVFSLISRGNERQG